MIETNAFIPAVLVLADGATFRGVSVGAYAENISGNLPGSFPAEYRFATGEVVFNTSMTGYQEILTDPSYARQIVTLTYPHIGNTGTNIDDCESTGIYATGLVIRDLPRLARAASNYQQQWRSEQSLQEFLQMHGVVAIAEVDTRALTSHLRDTGAQAGCILTGFSANDSVALDEALQFANQQARGFPGLAGLDLAKEVSCTEAYTWANRSWSLDTNTSQQVSENASSKNDAPLFHVVVMDFGVKHNILRMLVDRDCRVTVVPAMTTADAIKKLSPDGVFLSNGPGDPEPCRYAIETIATLLENDLPMFGICLGHQLLAIASGAKTLKMKFGHHGANHPVQSMHAEESTMANAGRVMISSQNHGFSVDPESLGSNLKVTHKSLFDNSIQGISRTDRPAFGFQGHPEASPGPHDVSLLFDQFVQMMCSHRATNRPQHMTSNSITDHEVP